MAITKSDLLKTKNFEEINKFAKEKKIVFLICSAKTGSHIQKVFICLLDQVASKNPNLNEIIMKNQMKLKEEGKLKETRKLNSKLVLVFKNKINKSNNLRFLFILIKTKIINFS